MVKHTIGLRAALLVLAALAILPAGCGKPQQPLRVGLLVWPAYELPYLAQHLGYYDGLNLQLVEFHSPAEALRAYRSDGVDAVAVTINYLIQLAARNPVHQTIMVINVSDGADAVLARPDIDDLGALKGRRIGVERSALGAYMLSRMLDHAGLEQDDIRVVSMDVADTPAAFRGGDVDAVVTYEPFRTRVLDAGAVELFSSRDIPGEIVDVLVTRTDTIESQAEQLGGLIEGWLRAVEYLEERPLEAAAILAPRERLEPAQYLNALENIELADRAVNRRMLAGSPPDLYPVLRRAQTIMQKAAFIRNTAAVEKLVASHFVEAAPD